MNGLETSVQSAICRCCRQPCEGRRGFLSGSRSVHPSQRSNAETYIWSDYASRNCLGMTRPPNYIESLLQHQSQRCLSSFPSQNFQKPSAVIDSGAASTQYIQNLPDTTKDSFMSPTEGSKWKNDMLKIDCKESLVKFRS